MFQTLTNKPGGIMPCIINNSFLFNSKSNYCKFHHLPAFIKIPPFPLVTPTRSAEPNDSYRSNETAHKVWVNLNFPSPKPGAILKDIKITTSRKPFKILSGASTFVMNIYLKKIEKIVFRLFFFSAFSNLKSDKYIALG